MIVITNILAWPFVIAVWFIDTYILLINLRLVVGRLSSTRNTIFHLALRQLTEPLYHTANRWLSRWRNQPLPTWIPWLVVIVTALLLRHLFVWIAVSIQ